jgi:sortase A
MPQSSRPKIVGTVLIAVGVLLLIGVLAAFGWQQWQGATLRQQLRAQATSRPEPTGAVAASPEPANPELTKPAPELSTPLTPDAPAATPTDTMASTATPTKAASQPSTAIPTELPATKPVKLQIPDLKIDAPVTDMGWKIVDTATGPQSDWIIPENAAGRAINSSLLGEPGNMVVSGHNNIYGRVLMPLSQAWPENDIERVDAFTERSNILDGHKVILQGADGRQFEYVVKGFYRVKDSGVSPEQRIKNGKYMDPTPDTRLTLTTCWPPWSNTHRLILVAQPAG